MDLYNHGSYLRSHWPQPVSPLQQQLDRAIRERSEELNVVASVAKTSKAHSVSRIMRMLRERSNPGASGRKRCYPSEDAIKASAVQIGLLRHNKMARRQQLLQQLQQPPQQLQRHNHNHDHNRNLRHLAVVPPSSTRDQSTVAAYDGLDGLVRRRALETARELRSLRNSVGRVDHGRLRDMFLQRAAGPSLPASSPSPSPSTSSSHSRFVPPERREELQMLQRNTRVSALLHSSGFRFGLETMLRSAPGQASRGAAGGASGQSSQRGRADHVTPTPTPGMDGAGVRPVRAPIMPRRQRLVDPHFSAVEQNPLRLLMTNVRDEVDEINHLRQVTSILGSAFREALESHLVARAEQLGEPARARAAEALSNLRSLRSTRGRQGQGRWHDQRPRRGTTSFQDSNDIGELAQLVRASYDLQLDIHRAIQMEVAAALSRAGLGDGYTLPSPTPTKSKTSCIVCLDCPRDTLLYSCGHFCMCNTCARSVKMKKQGCPVCRAPITDVVRVYDA